MAVSGAAVATPQIDDMLGRTLLTLANFRMGEWMPNPGVGYWLDNDQDAAPITRLFRGLYRLQKPTSLNLFLQWALLRWLVPPRKAPFVFVSDGGHFENLGIEPLFERRCRIIIVSDATEDSDYRFEDFSNLLHRMQPHIRVKQGCLGALSRLRPHMDSGLAREHFQVIPFEYVDPKTTPASESVVGTGFLIYIKPNLTGDENELLEWRRANRMSFPQDPTGNQHFEDEVFGAYRRLGFHIGLELGRELFANCNGSSGFLLTKSWDPSGGNGPPPCAADVAIQPADEVPVSSVTRDELEKLVEADVPARILISLLKRAEDDAREWIGKWLRDYRESVVPELELALLETKDPAFQKNLLYVLGEFAKHEQRASSALGTILHALDLAIKGGNGGVIGSAIDALENALTGNAYSLTSDQRRHAAELIGRLQAKRFSKSVRDRSAKLLTVLQRTGVATDATRTVMPDSSQL